MGVFTAMNIQVADFWIVTPRSASTFTLKMVKARSSETLVSYHITNGITTQKITT
jgi:hypothetical protein